MENEMGTGLKIRPIRWMDLNLNFSWSLGPVLVHLMNTLISQSGGNLIPFYNVLKWIALASSLV